MWSEVYTAFEKECNALGIHSIQEYGHPTSILRYEGDQLIGSAHYEEKDMFDRSYTPWITSLYVVPSHRNKGIATSILKEAMQKYAPFYIYCETKYKQFYIDMGFFFVEERNYLEKNVTILKFD